MMRFRRKSSLSEPTLQMTSMIDIVFLLLVFFVMTFKVVLPEGDFPVSSSAAATGQAAEPDLTEPIRVRLSADRDGELAQIRVGDRKVASLAEMQQRVWNIAGYNPAQPATMEATVELAADESLSYQALMDAFTAVRGKIGARGEVLTIIERIKLAPGL